MTQPGPAAQGGSEGAQGGAPGDGTGSGAAGTGTDPGQVSGQGAATGQAGAPPADASAGTVSQAEYERRMLQLQAADKAREAAQAELKQLKEKDMPAMEKMTKDLAEAQARAEKAETELKKSRLDNAFFNDNTYKWKNPKTALKLADLSKVEVDEDGTVHNLKGALEALAKSDPYLLEDKSDDDDDTGKGGKGSTGALGTGGTGGKPDVAKTLAARLPALRTRGIGGN